ncbi:tyrosine decarboxylase [Purpureocillium lavendulum]|uniref:Tyrosine decarboxylase n=1 Tax=Purpureocillium lavendulum TaxID=1247861 RepID=A0AB34FXE9_9HYPO|nr:tyrosine decarboxylase [Purpureocillium lavendulum]
MPFLDEHPGGAKILKRFAGKNATKAFWKYHSENVLKRHGPKYEIGEVAEAAKLPQSGYCRVMIEPASCASSQHPHDELNANLFTKQHLESLDSTHHIPPRRPSSALPIVSQPTMDAHDGGILDPAAAEKRLLLRHADGYDDASASTTARNPPTLPTQAALRAAEASLAPRADPGWHARGWEGRRLVAHILGDVVPALTGQAASSRYYGFVTGGVLPAAEWADNVVSRCDQNVQVHLPGQTVATAVEDAALAMLAGLLRLESGSGSGNEVDEMTATATWRGRTFTTGATASNVLGLACGREAVLQKRLGASDSPGVGELGLLAACLRAGVSEVQVLTSAGHSSLSKAASIVGIGRACVKELRRGAGQPWRLDLDALEAELRRPGVASIIAVSAGDVNTGGFALDGVDEWRRVRELADKYGSWIHVDGAFGIFARVLGDGDEYAWLKKQLDGIELADSITVDGHKMLNVPYDCGMFYTRSASILQSVFTNPNAAYLASGSSAASIPSPLNIGLENSRRFRALPVYAALLSEGYPGFERLVANTVQLSRRVAGYLRDSPHYELLPDAGAPLDRVFMIVLFRARDAALNDVLVERINETRQMYVSGTAWGGQKAVRIAVSNWKVDVERDFKVVTAILEAVAAAETFDIERIDAQ